MIILIRKIFCCILAIILCISTCGCMNKSNRKIAVITPEPSAHSFLAEIKDISRTTVTVVPLSDQAEANSCDRICFSANQMDDSAEIGSIIRIYYDGNIMETSPARINAARWELITDLRTIAYSWPWLDKTDNNRTSDNIFGDVVISRIFADCFLCQTVIPTPYQIKINGTISEKWCVGDQVLLTYENTYYDPHSERIEADLVSIDSSSEEITFYKPVIYLYPQKEESISVKLHVSGGLTCTYPSYKNGWHVTASPDGTLTDSTGQTYNYLYWEGLTNACWDLSQGFCVKGEDTAAFLEESLSKLGLNRREANEFIVYWLPLMEVNPYNIITFQTDVYTQNAKLDISPTPDSLLRIFMVWFPSEQAINIPEQTLQAPERTGFTVVEWGGTML